MEIEEIITTWPRFDVSACHFWYIYIRMNVQCVCICLCNYPLNVLLRSHYSLPHPSLFLFMNIIHVHTKCIMFTFQFGKRCLENYTAHEYTNDYILCRF